MRPHDEAEPHCLQNEMTVESDDLDCTHNAESKDLVDGNSTLKDQHSVRWLGSMPLEENKETAPDPNNNPNPNS